MQMADYPIQNIHLPVNKASVSFVNIVSVLGAVATLSASILILFSFLLSLDFAVNIFGKDLVSLPTVIGVIISSVIVFIYRADSKSRVKHANRAKLSLVLGLVVLGMGALSFSSNFNAGLAFCFLGLGITISFAKVVHRYHYLQFLAVIILFINLFGILSGLYHFFSPEGFSSSSQIEFGSSLLFFVLSQSIILARADRGFVAIFTSDNHTSRFARILLVYFAILPPMLGVIILLFGNGASFDFYGQFALFTSVVMATSVVVAWVSMKLLYSTELEHFLMKEALRVNNISLELNTSDLSSKVSELEEEKKNVVDKYNNQQVLADLIDKTG